MGSDDQHDDDGEAAPSAQEGVTAEQPEENATRSRPLKPWQRRDKGSRNHRSDGKVSNFGDPGPSKESKILENADMLAASLQACKDRRLDDHSPEVEASMAPGPDTVEHI